MKKIFCIIMLIMLVMFLIPTLFTNKRLLSSSVNIEEKENETEIGIVNYDYSKYDKIKLLHKDTGKVEQVNLDEYIACVVSAEMPANYDIEALKAQAIVARTYTIYKITTSKKHNNADICDKSTCCQAWISKEDRLKKWKEEDRVANWNKISKAVNDTLGKIVTYNGKPINAFFHSNSGGKTEVPLYVWGGTGYPYLQVVETAGEDAYSQFSSQAKFTKDDFIKKVTEKHKNFKIDFKEKDCIKITQRDESRKLKFFRSRGKNITWFKICKFHSRDKRK